MGKSKKNKDSKPEKFKGWVIALVGLVILGFGASYLGWLPGSGPGEHPTVVGGETRPLLPAHLFGMEAGLAYAKAAQHPKAFDQVFCYCGCDKAPFNHKSLLSCFADKHGST